MGGEGFGKLLERETLIPRSNVNSAIQIIKALQYLHFQHIIHKDIKPRNIIINSQTKQVKLTEFGIATKLNKENPQFNNPNSLEGTLAYMSPKQTGRINRTLDYRTDFYSLGITLSERLTVKLPFPSNDPLKRVYSHIAFQPIYPHQINSEIPAAISEIVMNLLANAIECFDESNQGRTYAEIEALPNTIAIITQVSEDSNSVVIKIKDNGQGMSSEVKSKIFDHLFTTKGVGKGTGLGLSISRQIVEETHGGKLTCESVLGEGTEFAIALPL